MSGSSAAPDQWRRRRLASAPTPTRPRHGSSEATIGFFVSSPGTALDAAVFQMPDRRLTSAAVTAR
jgi:hypothetical protein